MIKEINGVKYVIPSEFRTVQRCAYTNDTAEVTGKYCNSHGYYYEFTDKGSTPHLEADIGGKTFIVPLYTLEYVNKMGWNVEDVERRFRFKTKKASSFVSSMKKKYKCNSIWLWNMLTDNFNIQYGLNCSIYEDEAAEAEEIIKKSLADPLY